MQCNQKGEEVKQAALSLMSVGLSEITCLYFLSSILNTDRSLEPSQVFQ